MRVHFEKVWLTITVRVQSRGVLGHIDQHVFGAEGGSVDAMEGARREADGQGREAFQGPSRHGLKREILELGRVIGTESSAYIYVGRKGLVLFSPVLICIQVAATCLAPQDQPSRHRSFPARHTPVNADCSEPRTRLSTEGNAVQSTTTRRLTLNLSRLMITSFACTATS